MSTHVSDPPITVIVTRPSGQGHGLCRALRRRGIAAISLPAMRLAPVTDDEAAARALRHAFAGDLAVFTSPKAVQQAHRLLAAQAVRKARLIAVGEATARALDEIGWGPAITPPGSGSEAVLQLACLRQPRGARVAVIGAAGGRSLLPDTLAERGAQVARVPVYRRLPARLDARHWQALEAARGVLVTTATSARSLQMLSTRVPEAGWRRLLAGIALASSERLQAHAQALGFARIARADSATDADLLAAIGGLF